MHEKGHAMAMGRGVYTSRDFGKACQYATPHIFLEHDIKVLVRGVLLVPLPQASTLQQPPNLPTGHTAIKSQNTNMFAVSGCSAWLGLAEWASCAFPLVS